MALYIKIFTGYRVGIKNFEFVFTRQYVIVT